MLSDATEDMFVYIKLQDPVTFSFILSSLQYVKHFWLNGTPSNGDCDYNIQVSYVQYCTVWNIFCTVPKYPSCNFLDQSNFFCSGRNNLCWCMVNVLYYHVLTTCVLIRKCLGTICMNYAIILVLQTGGKSKERKFRVGGFWEYCS